MIRGPGLRPQGDFPFPQAPDKVNFQEGRRGRWRNLSRRPAEVSHKTRVSPDEAHEIACGGLSRSSASSIPLPYVWENELGENVIFQGEGGE